VEPAAHSFVLGAGVVLPQERGQAAGTAVPVASKEEAGKCSAEVHHAHKYNWHLDACNRLRFWVFASTLSDVPCSSLGSCSPCDFFTVTFELSLISFNLLTVTCSPSETPPPLQEKLDCSAGFLPKSQLCPSNPTSFIAIPWVQTLNPDDRSKELGRVVEPVRHPKPVAELPARSPCRKRTWSSSSPSPSRRHWMATC